jgi:hypothetical protein
MEIQEILNKASKITQTKYILTIDEGQAVDLLLTALEEVINEYDYLFETFKEYEQEINDNYKPISKEEQIYG